MTERLNQPLRGIRRRNVEAPLLQPDIDIAGVKHFENWRERYYKKPILDKLTVAYQFQPTRDGVEAYTRPDPVRMPEGLVAVGSKGARELLKMRAEQAATRERQRIHIAETAELATALFWSVAVVRKTVLHEAYGDVSEDKQPRDEVAAYAADAIQDLGLCLESPVEKDPRFINRRGRALSKGLKIRLDEISPDLGQHIASFGAYAVNHPEALRSADGVVLLEAALIEQDYRIATWQPRHQAIVETFRGMPESREILQLQLPLPEMLAIQDRLTTA